MVSRRDPRIAVLEKTHENVGPFLDRFTDAFGVRVNPTALLVRKKAPPPVYTTEALAGFRDLVAMSVIPRNRSWELKHGRQNRILWSDMFAFYPWTLDKNHQYLVAQTPALLGLHIVEEFHGQSTPELPSQLHLDRFSIDEPMLDALIKRWRRRYLARTPHTDDLKLFRSLNMANQASRTPAGRDSTFYDVGRSIALWVSAFEILAHTGKGGRSGSVRVVNLLDRNAWLRARLRARSFKIHAQRDKGRFAPWLYAQINKARNDFLHGNPATTRNLRIKRSGQSLFVYAAPLYRMALAAFLDLAWSKEPPDTADGGTRLGEWIAERYDFNSYQQVVEDGLLTALKRQKEEFDWD